MKLMQLNRSSLLLVLSCFFVLGSRAQSVPQPKFNEYSCANFTTLTDAFGNTPDWIEIYNPSATTTMNLSGYYMSNDKFNLSKWQFPINTTVPPQGFITVYTSGEDTVVVAAGEYHTSFDLLQTKPQQIIISDYNGVVKDSLTLRRNQKDHSWGKPGNGGAVWKLYSNPTPGASNPTGVGTSYIDYKAKPVFSLAPGSYAGSQTLSLTSTQTAVKIKYTTDGSDPATSGTATTGVPPINGISIASSRVIRAICVDNPTLPAIPTYLNSFVETNTYLLPPNNNFTFPVVSVSVPDTVLFFAGTTMDATFEYFEKSHQFVFETVGFAGKPLDEPTWTNKQKGFDYYAEDECGYSYTNTHQFFDDPMLGASQRTDFTTLVFKSALEDNFPQGGTGTGGNQMPCHLRDAFSQSYSFRKNFNIDGRHYEPIIMMVNGKYWGIYDLHEEFDNEYTKYYDGQDDIMNLQYVSGSYLNTGPLNAWSTDWNNVYNFILTNSMNVPANYAQADSMMDFKSFMDYMIWNTYAVNGNFDQQNMEWRGTDPTKNKHKWNFGMFNMDNTWGLGNDPGSLGNTSHTSDPCDYQAAYPASSGSTTGHPALLVKLMTNDTFKSAFINRWADLLNTSLSCDSLTEHFNYMRAFLTPEMQRHYARWAGSNATATYYYSPPNDSLADWNRNLDEMSKWINQRCNFIDSAITSCYQVKGPFTFCVDIEPASMGTVLFNSLTITGPYSGEYFGGVYMNAIAVPVTNYYFDHWETTGFTLVDSLVRQDTITWKYDSISCIKAVFRLKEPYNTIGDPLVPTGFSPNGDGNNDVLNVYGTRNVTNFEIEIYNRWGQSVFKSNDKTVGWDGKFSGVDAPVGVYAYRFVATVDGVDVAKKGNITLIR
ncbi:MAG: CotH kinase family protein [Bacteroidia bacterium]